MIVSFRNRETEAIANRRKVSRFVAIERVVLRKLRQLKVATRFDDLLVPLGNRLEALRGRRSGQHSIRVNDQYRIWLSLTPNGPADVEIVDYH